MYNSHIPTVIEKDHPLNKTGLRWEAHIPPRMRDGCVVFNWRACHPIEGVSMFSKSNGGNIYDLYDFMISVVLSEAEALLYRYVNRIQEEDKADTEAEADNLLTLNKEC